MTEIKASRVLDMDVLVALGAVYRESWKAEDGCWKMSAWYYQDGSVACREEVPWFSNDVNAAFTAAERTWKEFAVKRMPSGQYEATAFCDGDDGWSRFYEQPSPALAICAGILSLNGNA